MKNMTRFFRYCLPAAALAGSALGFSTLSEAATLASDGSALDVASKISAAADGDIVTIPTGTFVWTTGVSVDNKSITLSGAGSGRIIGRSTSSVTIGTGAKTFSTQSGLPIAKGQTLLIERVGKISNFMQGVVTDYTGTTLQMDINATGGSATESLWIISSQPGTTIIHSAGAAGLISVTEASTRSTHITGIQFKTGSGTGDYIRANRNSALVGLPIQVHDCWFRSTSSTGNCIFTNANRGIIYRCSFDSSPFSMAPLAIHQKDCPATSWTTPSTMGIADATGTSNLYVEDCDFHAWLNATDIDDCARIVFRHNLMNNAGFGTHGADSSPYGVRHYEVYNNEFVFNGYTNGTTFNLNWWFFLRGGTGVIADNILPNIYSQDYGDKPEINATVMNLQRSSGPDPLWGKDVAGAQLPAPRQVGYGYVTGKGTDYLGRINDVNTYVGDLEPLYIFGNTTETGTSWNPTVGLSDYVSTSSPPSGTDVTASYIVAGKTYFNDGTVKPGYTKYTYPHPLRTAISTPTLAAPTNTRVISQ